MGQLEEEAEVVDQVELHYKLFDPIRRDFVVVATHRKEASRQKKQFL